MPNATANIVDIQNPNNQFKKEIIKTSLNCTDERRATDVGELYDDLVGQDITVTTYFHAQGWYHITNVDAKSEATEREFWNNLHTAVKQQPHQFNPA